MEDRQAQKYMMLIVVAVALIGLFAHSRNLTGKLIVEEDCAKLKQSYDFSCDTSYDQRECVKAKAALKTYRCPYVMDKPVPRTSPILYGYEQSRPEYVPLG